MSPVFFPFAEYGMTCCVFNERLYMVGGQTARVDVYDFKLNEWERVEDCFTRRMEAQVKW